MQKRKFNVQVFKCPDCGNKMYAPKRISRMTVPGRKKALWCPWCRKFQNMKQAE